MSVRAVVAGLELAGVPRSAVRVTLFSEGVREWFVREGLLSILPDGMAPIDLRLGDKGSTAADIDAMARADVLVLGRSSFSNVVATITRALVVLNAFATDSPEKHELAPAVMPEKSGYIHPEEIARAWWLADRDAQVSLRRRLTAGYVWA